MERKYTPISLRALLLLACLVWAGCMKGDSVGRDLSLYKKWQNLPAEELNDKGCHYMYTPGKYDSAMVAWSIVANRYYERDLSRSELKYAVSGMNNIGYMYYTMFHDYEKSYQELTKALDVSEKTGMHDVAPYIYLNLADLHGMSDRIFGARNRNETAGLYQKAFDLAYELKDWKAFLASYNYLAYLAYKTGRKGLSAHLKAVYPKAHIPANTTMYPYSRTLTQVLADMEAGRTEAALEGCDKLRGEVDDYDAPDRFVLVALLLKADLYDLDGQPAKALETLREAENVAVEMGNKDLLLDIYGYLEAKCRQAGMDAEAVGYEVRGLKLKNDLLVVNKLGSKQQMKTMDRLRQINEEVIMLHKEKKLHMVIAVLSLSATAIILLLFVALRVQYRKVKRGNAQLYLRITELLEKERKTGTALQAGASAEPKEEQRAEKYAGSSLSDVEKSELEQRITQVMEHSEEVFNEDFNIGMLAELCNSKVKHVSQVINECLSLNFNELLGKYRIKEACRRFNDQEAYGGFTIEAISASVGFKSRPNFVSVFKKNTGLTPREFQKLAKSGLSENALPM